MMRKEMPTGVKIISVLYYIGAVIGVVVGIMLFIGASALDTLSQQNPALATFGSGFAIVGGIIFIALAVLGFFVGRGLWAGMPWARITVIVLSCVGVLLAILSLVAGDFTSIVSLLVNGILGGYLLFSSSAKQAFS